MPPPAQKTHRAVRHGERADRDIGVHAAIKTHVADGATIDAAPEALHFVDDFHRTQLGCAGDGATRKAATQKVYGITSRAQAAGDRAHQMMDGGVAFHFEQPRHTH